MVSCAAREVKAPLIECSATAILALLLSPGVGAAAVQRVLAAARALERPAGALFDMPARELLEALPPSLVPVAKDVARCTSACHNRAEWRMERAAGAGTRPLTLEDADYPPALSRFLGGNAPPLLFVTGNAGLLRAEAAAIVGARKVSDDGRRLAIICAETFCAEAIPVVSGGAEGVDLAAHEAQVSHGGSTVAVLPQGTFTYRSPAFLARPLREGRAALVSEFPPDLDWSAYAAVTRNATISALSKLVCVIEPKKEGGSIRTARCAMDQGKRVAVYCASGARSPAETLRRAGAHDLLEKDGSFSAQRLLDMWRTTPEPPEGQAELF